MFYKLSSDHFLTRRRVIVSIEKIALKIINFAFQLNCTRQEKQLTNGNCSPENNYKIFIDEVLFFSIVCNTIENEKLKLIEN